MAASCRKSSDSFFLAVIFIYGLLYEGHFFYLNFISVIANFAKKRIEPIFKSVEPPRQFDITVRTGAEFVQGTYFPKLNLNSMQTMALLII